MVETVHKKEESHMPTIPNRQYTKEFQEAAVTQVLESDLSG
jgi:transposase-like protein